ncbi:MAG: hypothetical protein IKO35_04980 [Elusimicrobiaceae bacterium]|nr:hypothetical protein [Elusimicrobiaceae bacterium]
MSAKQLIMGVVLSVFCCACASLQYDGRVHRVNGYSNSTKFIISHHAPEKVNQEEEETDLLDDIMYITSSKYRKEADAQPETKKKMKITGYIEYFDIVGKNSSLSYQLIYYRPSGENAGKEDYYLVVVNGSQTLSAQPITQATLDGQSLPLAYKGQFLGGFSINIKLTRSQIINAYKNAEKAEILLQVDEQTYKVSFPGYYLRDVLNKTY